MTTRNLIMASALAFSSMLIHAQNANTKWENLPIPSNNWVEMVYNAKATTFQLWAPTAEKVCLRLYKEGSNGKAWKTIQLKRLFLYF